MELDVIYNEDCYSGIKNLPDNSVDLVYIDIPYDLEGNGGGGCFGEKKRDYHKEYEQVSKNTNASRLWKSKASSSSIADIAFGIDWAILDELIARNSSNVYEETDFIYLSFDELLDINNEIINCITNNMYYFNAYNYGVEVEQINYYLLELAEGIQSIINVMRNNQGLMLYYSLD